MKFIPKKNNGILKKKQFFMVQYLLDKWESFFNSCEKYKRWFNILWWKNGFTRCQQFYFVDTCPIHLIFYVVLDSEESWKRKYRKCSWNITSVHSSKFVKIVEDFSAKCISFCSLGTFPVMIGYVSNARRCILLSFFWTCV